jgi:mannose-6-phosphate isomerase-like protein (cupin superfamily)
MSQMRQPGTFDRSGDRKSAITTLARDYAAGHVIPLHFHDRDQLVYASRGVMTVRTRDGTWVVPPQRAVWIPAGVPHIVTMSGSVAMRTLYLKPRLARGLPRDCSVINVPTLLKELVLYACTLRRLRNSVRWQVHLIAIILHQLEAVQTVPLQLPHLSDPRLVRIAEIFIKNPCDSRTLAQLCRVSGGQQAFHRTTVSTGNRNDVWEMAAAASADARNAPVSRRREGDSRCLGMRLQYAERFHFHV